MKVGLLLMKNLITPLAKSVLIPLGLTAAAVAADAGIDKKIIGCPLDLAQQPYDPQVFGSGTTTLKISNKEMENVMKIVKSLEEPGLLVKDVSETIENETKEPQGFLVCY